MIKQKPFAIMRCIITNPLISDISTYKYIKLTLPYRESVIRESEAKRLIDTNKMTVIVNNKHGKVWELANNSFKKAYKIKEL